LEKSRIQIAERPQKITAILKKECAKLKVSKLARLTTANLHEPILISIFKEIMKKKVS